MQSITIRVKDDQLLEKVTWLLEHFKSDGLEILSKEDATDLKLLRETRGDELCSFDDYLKQQE